MTHAGLSGANHMPKSLYVDLYTRLCKALLEEGEEWDEDEAVRLTEDAWKEETRGGVMTRTMFNDSLFEYARAVTAMPYALIFATGVSHINAQPSMKIFPSHPSQAH